MPSAEIEFEELKLEIIPNVYIPVIIKGDAIFNFDKYGVLESVDGIYVETEGFVSQLWLRNHSTENPERDLLTKLIKKALEDQYTDIAWEATGATAVKDLQEHGTY